MLRFDGLTVRVYTGLQQTNNQFPCYIFGRLLMMMMMLISKLEIQLKTRACLEMCCIGFECG